MSKTAGWHSMGMHDFFLCLCSISVDDVHNCCCIGPIDMISMVASLEWLVQEGYIDAPCRLRADRRPKPPTLKEQALKGFDDISQFALGELEGTSDYEEYKKIADTVLKALESL